MEHTVFRLKLICMVQRLIALLPCINMILGFKSQSVTLIGLLMILKYDRVFVCVGARTQVHYICIPLYHN